METNPSAVINFHTLLNSDFIMFIALAIIMLIASIWIWNQHKDSHSTISLIDLVAYKGKLSSSKTMRLLTWVVSSWGFIFLIIDHNLTEFYFIGYMTAWAANAIFERRQNAKIEEDREDREYV